MPTPTERHAAYLAALDRWIAHEERRPAARAGLTMHLDGLRGRRSILVRHAPEWYPTHGWVCARCRNGIGERVRWGGCPDWRDAAGLLPEEAP